MVQDERFSLSSYGFESRWDHQMVRLFNYCKYFLEEARYLVSSGRDKISFKRLVYQSHRVALLSLKKD